MRSVEKRRRWTMEDEGDGGACLQYKWEAERMKKVMMRMEYFDEWGWFIFFYNFLLYFIFKDNLVKLY